MASYAKKLLVSSALVFAGFSQVAIGSQTITETLAPQGHVKHVQCQESQPLSAWGICSSFVTSLFEPFTQDAPTALNAIKEQKEILHKQGIQEYASNVATHAAEFMVKHPLDAVMLTGSMAMGWNVADASVVPLLVYISNTLKNGQAAWTLVDSACSNISSNKEIIQAGLYGLTLAYMVSSLVPAVDAALTPTFGTPFQIDQSSIRSTVAYDTTGLPGDKIVVVRTSDGNPPDIIGRIFYSNGTMVTNEFNITTSAAAASTSTLVSVATLENGNFFVSWESNMGSSIFSRIYNPNGNAVTNPFHTEQVTTYSVVTRPSVAGLMNGNAVVTWDAVNDSGSFIPGRIFSSTGQPITNEFSINPGTEAGLNSFVVGVANGNALAFWYYSNLYGRFIFPNGTFASAPFPINQTAITSTNPTTGAALTDGSVFVPYATAAGDVARIVQTSSSISSEFLIGIDHGPDGTSAAGLIDGTVLAVLNPPAFVLIGGELVAPVSGKLFNSAGTNLTEFSIPSSNTNTYEPPSVSARSTGGAFVTWQTKTPSPTPTYHLMGCTVSFSVPPTPTSHPTAAPAPAPTSGAAELTPSLGLAAIPFLGYLANWWRVG